MYQLKTQDTIVDRKSQSPYAMDHSSAADHGHNLHMFLEDVRLHLIPPDLNSHDDARIVLLPSDVRLILAAITLFAEPSRSLVGSRDLRPRDLSRFLSEFIKVVAVDLAHKGTSFWELGQVHVGNSNSNASPMLLRIYGDVAERRNAVRQRYSQVTEGKRTRHEVALPSSSVQVFRLPRRFGTVRAQRGRIGLLQEASTIQPSFVQDSLSRLEQDPLFDHSEYSRAQFLAISKCMRDWGWIGRFWENKYTTEYYWFWHKIKFHKSLAVLRESIVRDMNALLKRLEIDCEIQLRGVKTAEEISGILEKLKNGSISFGDAIDQAHS